MSDYKQTRDAAGRVTSTFGKMLEGLNDDDLIDRITALIAERDEAWKRAVHAEEMWGRLEAELSQIRKKIE